MTKGFGAIMAEVSMAQEKANRDVTVACPLCGQPMTDEGVAFFCYHERDNHIADVISKQEAAYEYQKKGGVVFWLDISTSPQYRFENWNPDMQGVLLAVATKSKEIVGEFGIVRGRNGKSNFRVTLENGANVNDVNNATWRFAEWWASN